MVWSIPWVWLVAAFVLGIAETLLPGFILLGFALGALLTSILLWIGVIGGSLAWVLLVFAVGSALGWFVLKKAFMRPGQAPKIWRTDINDDHP